MDGESRKKKRDQVLITDVNNASSLKHYIWDKDFKTDGEA